MRGFAFLGCLAVAAAAAQAEPVIDVKGVGQAKVAVEIHVADQAFRDCLAKNLVRSGVFKVEPRGSVRVSGVPGAIRAEGAGKVVSSQEAFSDAPSARMAARRLSDAMCEAFGQQKGFAMDKIVFLNRGRAKSRGAALPAEICTCYADGYDIREVTGDGKMTVFPRWKTDGRSIYYISDKNGAPQIWEMDTASGRRSTKWSFKGSPTGIAVSPDGSRVAAILSFQGNPELYVLQGERFTRLTTTPLASEGQPTWSPDGKKIAYVSNENKRPQIFVIDVATKAKRRLTSFGRENIDPDWGPDGRIVYITKRGGAQVAVMSPAEGDAKAQLVTDEANWEHPSWSRDRRNVVANRDGALFIIDTEMAEGGKANAPTRVFSATGNWISPCWMR
ncbi:MAG: PD40 domain-containing protein [Kiritimatiellae bacterium]|nr:PD40 domain-containing protein [Kiritimatiellia bacterium]